MLAREKGLDVVEVLADNDVSAYSGRQRPAYQRLLELIGERAVGVVLAWHPDRLHRSPLELEHFIELIERAGVRVITVQTGVWDLSTPPGRLAARQLGAVARYESEHKSERIRRKHLELAQAGKIHGGGTRPFGFEDDRVTVREDEAQRIREGIEHVCRGGSLHSLAARWDREGVATVTGRPWRTQTLRTMLTAPRIAGLREHNGAIVADAVWSPIVDREGWEAARAILSVRPRRRGTGSGVPRRYLLTGIALCGVCAERLVARPRPGNVRAYVCAKGPNFNGCGKIRRTADPVEGLVRDMVLAALDGPGMAQAMRAKAGDDSEARRITDDLDGYRQRLEVVRSLFVEGAIDQDEYMRTRTDLIKRIDESERALARMAGREGVSDILSIDRHDLRGFWDGAGLERRRALVALAVESVVIHPATRGRNTFDPSRVEVVWAQ